MKRKILLSVLLIGVVAVLIGGATMAWFTDDAEVTDAEFTAGTVIVDVDGPSYETMEDKYIDNVNPGDNASVSWTIYNNGSKDAELRVNLLEAWNSDIEDPLLAKLLAEYEEASNLEELIALLVTDNVDFTLGPDSGWVMLEGDGQIWLYYTAGPVSGTYNAANPSYPLAATSVELPFDVTFDGELTDNKYMGATFTLGGTVEAIQSSNDAPETVWGEDWTNVTAEE